MDTSASETLAGFAILVTIGSVIIGFLFVGSFFIAAFNIASILKQTKQMNMRQAGIQSSLDKIIRIMEQQAKERV